MSDIQASMRKTAADLLADGRVEVVVGYEQGSLPGRTRPCYVRSPSDAERLVWNPFCANNLAVYLPRLFARPSNPRQPYAPPTVALLAKGCDLRSAVGLVKEHQVVRDKLVLVGVPCRGTVDTARLAAALGEEPVNVEVASDGTLAAAGASGKTASVAIDDVLDAACRDCMHAAPAGADVAVPGESRAPASARREMVAAFREKTSAERWAYFCEQVSRCIRCNACRQACPNCYCKTCFVDQTRPRWVGAGDDLSDVLLYHVGRIFHQAGRCVECDACVRACPMGIDLRTFTRELAQNTERVFDYVPGLSEDEAPPLCTFRDGDSEEFISEP